MKNRGIELVVAIFGLALLAQNANGADSTIVKVDLPKGTLQGLKTRTVLNGVTMYSFKGVRYAAPATGVHRFSVAREVAPWIGDYDATQHKSRCPQRCASAFKFIIGEDDCLFLNVYTSTLDSKAGLPVMFWLHGGSFNFGNGDSDVYGPDYLIENGVVLVSINYRLGPIGFLSTRDAAAPGNVGLKDQIAALRWVKRNIRYFGGDPNRVTIFGDAAGAGSVQYHMISPLSAGLFAHAIAQSGTVMTTWAITYNSTKDSFALGAAFGINTNNSTELVEGLLKINSTALVRMANKLSRETEGMSGGHYLFKPSVEVNVGQEIFLPADPWELLKTGRINDVPYMMGFNQDEMIIGANSIASVDYYNSHFEGFLPTDLNLTKGAVLDTDIKLVRNFYFNGKNVTKNDIQAYIKLQSDLYFTYGTAFSLKMMRYYMTKPIHQYLFSFDGKLGFFKKFFNVSLTSGVAHADETGYMFYPALLKITPDIGSEEEKMLYKITRMWTDFAKYGDPTPKLSENVTTTWGDVTMNGYYLHINTTTKMEQNVFAERVKFWANIYKDLLGQFYQYFK
uniref:Carboxylesterase 9 n=1 Tax=Cephus cinctus TaxID=211228 RepID=A0A1W6L1L4_CEPCN|nr:carboxylesterase 9 [Cephus cinctus]